MFSRFIHVVAYVRISFLVKAEQYSIVCVHCILFILSSVEAHLGCFHLWDTVNDAATSIDVQVSESLVLIILSIYLEAKFLDYVVILCLTF